MTWINISSSIAMMLFQKVNQARQCWAFRLYLHQVNASRMLTYIRTRSPN